jgi:hypothetical protein
MVKPNKNVEEGLNIKQVDGLSQCLLYLQAMKLDLATPHWPIEVVRFVCDCLELLFIGVDITFYS